MVLHDLVWHFMAFYGLFYGLLWLFMVFYGLFWQYIDLIWLESSFLAIHESALLNSFTLHSMHYINTCSQSATVNTLTSAELKLRVAQVFHRSKNWVICPGCWLEMLLMCDSQSELTRALLVHLARAIYRRPRTWLSSWLLFTDTVKRTVELT